MSGMSRRDLLRASAGAAAVAVPMSVLSSRGAGAASAATPTTTSADAPTSTATDAASVELAELSGPVMFCVRDGRVGEVSILHGDAEVIIRDRQLVDRIVRAAQRAVV
jgi:hypothetical protein